MRRFLPMTVMLTLMFGMGTQSRAAFVDQQNAVNNTFTVTAQSALGQSFTPTLNSIDFATFFISNTNASTYKVQVLNGDGLDGTLLGESLVQPVALAPLPPSGQPFTVDNAQLVQFDFVTPIALNPGSVYTLRVAQVSGFGGFFFLRTGLNNPYSGGQAHVTGAPLPTIDFVFSEGLRNNLVVPEPSSIALCGIAALFGLGYARPRSRPATQSM